jgi:hypothetical protein
MKETEIREMLEEVMSYHGMDPYGEQDVDLCRACEVVGSLVRKIAESNAEGKFAE